MNPMKRLGLAALLVLGVMLVASTPVQAKPPAPPESPGEDWGTIQLTKVGDEPRASGEATLTEVVLVDMYFDESGSVCMECYTARLRVDSKNLTPGATYSTPAGTLTANSRGKVTVAGDVYFWIGYYWSWDGWPPVRRPSRYLVHVDRLNPDGSSTRVLTGGFVPPSGW